MQTKESWQSRSQANNSARTEDAAAAEKNHAPQARAEAEQAGGFQRRRRRYSTTHTHTQTRRQEPPGTRGAAAARRRRAPTAEENRGSERALPVPPATADSGAWWQAAPASSSGADREGEEGVGRETKTRIPEINGLLLGEMLAGFENRVLTCGPRARRAASSEIFSLGPVRHVLTWILCGTAHCSTRPAWRAPPWPVLDT